MHEEKRMVRKRLGRKVSNTFLIDSSDIKNLWQWPSNHSKKVSKRAHRSLCVINKSYRKFVIDARKEDRERAKKNIEEFNDDEIDELFRVRDPDEYEAPPEYKLYISVLIDESQDNHFADLYVYHEKCGHRAFRGTRPEIEDILSFASCFLETNVELGDKAIDEYSDENVTSIFEQNWVFFEGNVYHDNDYDIDYDCG